MAIEKGWLWVGTDLSESVSIKEDNMAIRLLTDLSVVTSNVVVQKQSVGKIGFNSEPEEIEYRLNFDTLRHLYNETAGLAEDKLKYVLEFVWSLLDKEHQRGLIFAYDEAQNLSDHASKEQFPLSILLDVFQSIQKKGIPFMLVLTGLPTLFPKLVESRTFAKRMFRIIFLEKLSDDESREAILKPIEDENCPVKLRPASVESVVELSHGYPYFIQFICREIYDTFVQKTGKGEEATVPVSEIMRKLDTDFFAGRWAKATDRQRTLLCTIARLEGCDGEFSVQEIVDLSKKILEKSFGSSHVNQMLSSLCKVGLIYKNRYGKYSYAVPLLSHFIRRQASEGLCEL